MRHLFPVEGRFMHLSFLMFLASLLPQSAADPLCVATTVYLEARGESDLGQRAVAEVVLRRREDGRWGGSACEVVTAPKQFAPTLVNPNLKMDSLQSWQKAFDVAFAAEADWRRPVADRVEVVPGASHFAASYANPTWNRYPRVATIGTHSFYRVDRLRDSVTL
jgi:spore germination cell wall hydrolase CwlJ-like protein